jgi:hypothetical protein
MAQSVAAAMSERWQARVELSPSRARDAALLARMVGLGLVNEVLLKTLPLPCHLRLLHRARPCLEPTPCRTTVERHVRVARRLFQGRGRGPFRRSCLRQSLVLFRTLRSAGVPVTIQFGIARKGQGLDGHCWLELDGNPIAEREAREPRVEYRIVISYPQIG